MPIPTECQGARCASGIFPEYSFSSSNPDIADFVEPDPGSPNPRNVLLVKEKPVLDSHSGLLCAFNAGTTTVTVSAGGLAYSEKVTVLGGSVQRPCGTTPLRNQASQQPAVVPPLTPSPTPVFAGGTTPLPPPSAPTVFSFAACAHASPATRGGGACACAEFARDQSIAPAHTGGPNCPSPSSGRGATDAPERHFPGERGCSEREEEAAFDLVHHMAARAPEPRPASYHFGGGALGINEATGSGGGGVCRQP